MADVEFLPRPKAADTAPLIVSAHQLVARFPTLLSAARRLAATQLHGVHSRRRAGPGEDFWQYRRYSFGEPANSIDWRRSARSDNTFVREKEWQATHGFWFWVDLSSSMFIRSNLAQLSKADAALITLFALADRLVEISERAGLLGRTPALSSRNIAARFAESLPLTFETQDGLPPNITAPRFSDCVLISDFLNPVEEIVARCAQVAGDGARVHLVQMLDPIEETFPFEGRLQFVDPESNETFLAGRAEAYARRYKWALEQHKTKLRSEARARGWSYRLYHTGTPLASLALPLLLMLTQVTSGTAAGRGLR
ncbi:MAG: DUF58 domain-containing protein [Pseudomonadota bacterium]